MATSISNLADNLKEGIHKIKCKDYDCFLQYKSVKDNLITYKFADNDINNINKFVLSLRNCVYPNEYINE